MLEPSYEPEKFLKWLIGFIVLLFIIWLITGGPQRLKEGEGKPFIDPVTPPVGSEI